MRNVGIPAFLYSIYLPTPITWTTYSLHTVYLFSEWRYEALKSFTRNGRVEKEREEPPATTAKNHHRATHPHSVKKLIPFCQSQPFIVVLSREKLIVTLRAPYKEGKNCLEHHQHNSILGRAGLTLTLLQIISTYKLRISALCCSMCESHIIPFS